MENKRTENKSKEDAMAWIIKYLIIDSVENLFLEVIKGIMDKRLISKAIQEVIHDIEEITINVLRIKVLKNKNLKNFLIKKKRVITFINGVWTH